VFQERFVRIPRARRVPRFKIESRGPLYVAPERKREKERLRETVTGDGDGGGDGGGGVGGGAGMPSTYDLARGSLDSAQP